jgi:hypothetical protein
VTHCGSDKVLSVTMTRRDFTGALAGMLPAAVLYGQGTTASNEWGGPIVDCHHHMRRSAEANIAHLDGVGMSNVMLLAREGAAADIGALKAKYRRLSQPFR